MAKTTNVDLLLRTFKEKIFKTSSLKLNVGIPKEVESDSEVHNYRQELKQKSREERVLMADVVLNKKIKKSEEETYVADIAFKNNFGSFKEKIPARPFGSTLIPRYKEKIERVIRKELKAYVEGKQTLEAAYNRIGLACSGFMKDNLTNGDWKPNAPFTVFLKGSSRPLIDTGQMRQSITYVVKERDNE